MSAAELEVITELTVVGKRIPKIDSMEKLAGGGRYVYNISMPGMLYGKILRSPVPHANIKSIDVQRALELPGVKMVLTPRDVPKTPFTPMTYDDPYAPHLIKDMLLLEDRVRYVGDEVCAVCATDLDTAEGALSLINAEYEELPSVLDPVEAMKPGAPKIHEGGNIATSTSSLPQKVGWGDVEEGFRASDFVFQS